MSRRGPRRPNWPDWVEKELTPSGRRVLEQTHSELKADGRYDRGSRVSAEDIATVLLAQFRAQG